MVPTALAKSRETLSFSSAATPAVVAMPRSVRRGSSCRRPNMPSFLDVSRWCSDKTGAWLVLEHTHGPWGCCFGAADEAVGGGSFTSLLLVGTAPAVKAPPTGMLGHQGWPVRAAGIAHGNFN